MSEKNNYNNELIKAAMKMESADTEAAQKEKEYQVEQNVWWRQILRRIRGPQGEVDNAKVFLPLEIDGKEVMCELVDMNDLDFSDSNPEVRLMRKITKAKMRLSKDGDSFQPSQDGASPITLEAGYPVIENPGEDPYPFYNEGETPEESLKRFHSTYRETEEGSNDWLKKGTFRVIPVKKEVAIRPSWDPNGLMGTKRGGVIAEGGYTITPNDIKGNEGAKSLYEFVDEV